MEQLNGIVYADPSWAVHWAEDYPREGILGPGHIPGRPLLPGVLMIEAAAQVASFYTREFVGWKGSSASAGSKTASSACRCRRQTHVHPRPEDLGAP
jgi:3-hydroxyacyl-[acyl-carrier-protein] dehydratase